MQFYFSIDLCDHYHIPLQNCSSVQKKWFCHFFAFIPIPQPLFLSPGNHLSILHHYTFFLSKMLWKLNHKHETFRDWLFSTPKSKMLLRSTQLQLSIVKLPPCINAWIPIIWLSPCTWSDLWKMQIWCCSLKALNWYYCKFEILKHGLKSLLILTLLPSKPPIKSPCLCCLPSNHRSYFLYPQRGPSSSSLMQMHFSETLFSQS